MKKNLLLLSTLIAALSQLNAQVTRLSNNTNLEFGFPINSTKAVFTQAIDPNDENTRYNLWVTDGTAANTVQLAIPAKLESTDGIAFWNSKLYFSGWDATNGAELWVTDGTVAGTHMVKDINAGAGSSSPSRMLVYNNTLYFYAYTPATGAEFWKSDGTANGTSLVKDIYAGPVGSLNEDITYAVFKNQIFFSAVTAAQGLELWRSNGTEAGTVPVKDINPGAVSSTPEILQVYNNLLFFTATTAAQGTELWKTDGTTDGTVILKDIAANANSSNPSGTIIFKGNLFFSAENETGNEELYVTDGTLVGTKLVKDINPGTPGSDPDLASSIVINDKLIFAATSATTGRELFMTDGTPAGTVLFKDLEAGPMSSNPTILLDRNFAAIYNPENSQSYNETLYNGKIFFQTSTIVSTLSLPSKLWITDGTAANTTLVKDFGMSGLYGSYFYTKSGLYLTALDATKGYEIYKSQGTPATTNLFADVNVGADHSFPFFQFFILNGKVFFTADDGDSGEDPAQRDLYVLNGNETPLPLQLLNFAAATVTDGIALNWTTTNEINTKEFELQRSTDGNRFDAIGTVKAGGTTHAKKDYNYFDEDAYKQKSTTLYYRLKMVDNNGSFTYSRVAFIQLGVQVNKGLQASPNPARSFIRLNYASPSVQDAQIRIINSNGQAVNIIKVRFSEGVNQQVINTERLHPGIYHVELVMDGKQSATTRFIKQ